MTRFLESNQSNCKDCYKCIRHCPVKSIAFTQEQAHIIEDECILCGRCYIVCPQDAKKIANSLPTAQALVKKEKVVASIAPSFISYFPGVGIESLRKSLRQLGFFHVEETAIGATIVKKEYERLLAEKNSNVLISSCCHSINLLIQKYFPDALPYLADVVTPMAAHGLDIKRRMPDTKVVFIGPCISKKAEITTHGHAVDCVLTFEGLAHWLQEADISLETHVDQTEESRARLFPITGGILKTMDTASYPDYTYVAVDGITNSVQALESILRGEIDHCFIEMSACVGSCIGGPGMKRHYRSLLREYCAVTNYAGEADFVVEPYEATQLLSRRKPLPLKNKMPTPNEIKEILKKMGKERIETLLNCGSCGYNTCREKAIAIYQGKADVSMCLPFLKEKAENFSDKIIRNTPNGIIVLNEELSIQQINEAALGILDIPKNLDVINEPIIRILDPTLFIELKEQDQNIYDKAIYLAEYNKFIEFTLLYDQEYRIIICIMRDITAEQMAREKKDSMRKQTIETADQVVAKQMRIVQEIASLLGETAAETKIALTKLKESISDE